jgi:SSS family solute:Na+ symporter
VNFPLAIGSFFFFTALVGFISWWRTRRVDNGDAKTYFLADRKLPWIQIAGSLLLTNLSTEQMIGLNGAASVHGFVVMAWEIVPVFALIAMAWYFLPRYWSGNITTIPEFLEQRYDGPTRRLLGAVLLVTLALNFLPFVLYSGGVAMSSIFRLHEHMGITQEQSFTLMAWVIGVIGSLYVVLGGMKAVALSDTLYGVGLIVGAALIPVLGLMALGEGSFGDGLSRLVASQRPMLNPVGASDANVPFSTLFSGMLLINLFYWCANQVIVQRSFGASSFAEAQKGVLATAALKLLGPLYLVLPGIIALEMFGSSIGNGDLAYARLVEAVLPTWLVGFFAAVLLGSIISSFNGGLHSASTLFSMDIYRSWFRPGASDAQMLRAGKLFALGVCLLSILISGLLGGSAEGVFTLMKKLMAGFNIPLLSVVVMGMVTRRVPAWSAKVTLVAGVGTHFLLLYLFSDGKLGVKIHWLHLAAINAVLLCGFMLIAGLFTPAGAPAAVSRTGTAPVAAVDLTPWRGLRVASVVVAVLAVVLYFTLWLVARSR